MDQDTRKEFARLRRVGFGASQALRGAHINVAFAAAERRGLVRLDVVCDHECYDDSYIDSWTDVSASQREQARRETRARLESDGVWGVQTFARQSCGAMHEVDSCWGFLGDDWRDSGYDHDLRRTALDAIASYRQVA